MIEGEQESEDESGNDKQHIEGGEQNIQDDDELDEQEQLEMMQ